MTKEIAIEEFKNTWILTNKIRSVLRPAWIINWLWPIRISRWANYLIECLKSLLITDGRNDFEADGDYHDIWYYLWWTEDDRKKADIWFFDRLNSDILKLCLPAYKEIYYLTLSYIAYKSVRKYGYKYFNFKNKLWLKLTET